MSRVIDEFPTLTQVADADSYQIVCWHLFLRPTMSNDELPIVKQIAMRYDRMPANIRETLGNRARMEYA